MTEAIDVDCFLDKHDGFRYNAAKTRVICDITGHEIPCNLAALETYINGKKYKQLTQNGKCDLNKLAEYKEFLIPSRNGKQKLYCIVTKKEINNTPSHIQNHVIGRKFQKKLKIYKELMPKNESKEASNDVEDRKETENAEKVSDGSIDDVEEINEDDEGDAMNQDYYNNDNDDDEFAGGIWLPSGDINVGKGRDSNEVAMEDQDSLQDTKTIKDEKTVSRKGDKNILKRKLKDNKKSKFKKHINQKRKR